MSTNDFYTPTEIDALRMENELLSFEVRFLKARFADPARSVAEAERSVAEAARSVAEAERSVRKLRKKLAKAQQGKVNLQKRLERAESSKIPPHRLAQLESAEKDLTLLIQSMSGSPFARLLRLKKEFRDLEQRYL